MKKVKQFFKENKIGKIINSIGTGAIKATPFGNVIDEMKSNESDNLTGFGNTNIPRATTYALVGVLFIGRIGWPEHVNMELIQIILENI